ncbi:MAG: hypothetical protein FWG79_08140 [Bacteroidales bacterium]|nr:hypothetical protein [Bacteroidales bacterium]
MKKITTMTLAAIICGILFTACGGGSKSGLKKNQFLGALPAIYADYELKETSLKERAKKVANSGSLKKMVKEAQRQEEESTKNSAKFEADRKAEIKKIAGKTIPVSFKTPLWYDITAATLADNDDGTPTIVLTAKALDDVTVRSSDGPNMSNFYCRFLDKDGAVIAQTAVMLYYLTWGQTKTFATGDALKMHDGKDPQIYVDMRDPKGMVNFASLEFVSFEEYTK